MPWNAPDNVVVGFGLSPLPRVYGAAFVDSIIGATQIVGAMFPLYLQVVKHGNRCLFCIAMSCMQGSPAVLLQLFNMRSRSLQLR